jgi:hypothetical protein
MINLKNEKMFPDSNLMGGGMFYPYYPGTLEDNHHVFVIYPRYSTERQRRVNEFIRRITQRLLVSKELRSLDEHEEAVFRMRIIVFITEYFQDGNTWVGGKSRYYLGLVPDLSVIKLPIARHCIEESWELLFDRSYFGKFIHMEAIFTAGYIWSLRMKYQYDLTKERMSQGKENGKKLDTKEGGEGDDEADSSEGEEERYEL